MIGACIGLLRILVLVPFMIVKHRFLHPHKAPEQLKNIGFFHIPCHINGGGEKVLWAMVNKLVADKKYNITIYSDVIEDKQAMMDNVNRFFGYNLKLSDFNMLEIKSGYLTYAHHWKVFSRYLEALSHALVAFDALDHFMPDIFLESFTAPFAPISAKILNPHLNVQTYLHYPFTSKQFLSRYSTTFMDSSKGVLARAFAAFKYVYHYGLYLIYKSMGFFVDVCYSNSTWTQRLMDGIWGHGSCEILYPPCNIDEFYTDDFNKKSRTVISVAQFRWEKRQDVQLDCIKYHQKKHPESTYKFKIIGNSKFVESALVFKQLQDKIKNEGIKNVELIKDAKMEELRDYIKDGSLGIHTLINEPFGITIAEMLAGGVYILAHDSAGPKDDILGNSTHALYGSLSPTYKDMEVAFNQMLEDFDNPAKKAEMQAKVRAGQKFALDNLSNAAFAKKFAAKLDSIDKEFKVAAAEVRKQEQAQKKSAKKGEGDL